MPRARALRLAGAPPVTVPPQPHPPRSDSDSFFLHLRSLSKALGYGDVAGLVDVFRVRFFATTQAPSVRMSPILSPSARATRPFL